MTRRRYLGLSAAALLGGAGGSRAAGGGDPAVRRFMAQFGVPGISFAIARDGRIVRLGAYGFADLGRQEDLSISHRFRIASVSKPITAAAIFLLVERGDLELESLVFGDAGVLGIEGPGQIRIRHLLNHTAGGWRNDITDPMFKHPNLDHAELIRWTLETRPPVSRPGTAYAYSNFGYCLLGRVIEKLGGCKYEEFVRENVLEPCGAGGMEVGEAEQEVAYYMGGRSVLSEMNVARMDAHGGWVGTPSEMVAFGLHTDGFPEPVDLLEKRSLATMTARGGVNEGYAYGWNVNKTGNYWHAGSLPGLSSLLVRTAEGYCWAACANTRTKGINRALDQLMWDLARVV
ncbi:MAG: serine hydrolase domain-containing protein [Verrucomicrobiales bacterium]